MLHSASSAGVGVDLARRGSDRRSRHRAVRRVADAVFRPHRGDRCSRGIVAVPIVARRRPLAIVVIGAAAARRRISHQRSDAAHVWRHVPAAPGQWSGRPAAEARARHVGRVAREAPAAAAILCRAATRGCARPRIAHNGRDSELVQARRRVAAAAVLATAGVRACLCFACTIPVLIF